MFLYMRNLFIKKIIKSWNFLDNLIVLYYLKMYMNSKIACPKYFFFSVMCPLHHMNDMQHVHYFLPDKDWIRTTTEKIPVLNLYQMVLRVKAVYVSLSDFSSIASRPKMIVVNCHGHTKKCAQKMITRGFF